MSDHQSNRAHGPDWWRARLQRHMSELIRLAAPAVLMRLGLMGLTMVDVAMVGHYATEHLAWLNLANQTYLMFSIVVALGLQMGVVVHVSNAFGREDWRECGRIWRRTLPFAGGIGAIMALVAVPAYPVLLVLGQSPDTASEGARLIHILALGLPAHVLFITCSFFLEGIGKPTVGFLTMVIANLVNALFNYMLIYGQYGFPELGAEGSAWTSTIVRLVMVVSMLAYILFAPSMRRFAVREKPAQRWRDWASQRHMGYASAVSLAGEVAAFSALAVIAGWLGIVPLAAHGVVYQVLGPPLMIAIGIGVAASVRTGIAHGRGDRLDTILAGVCGILLAALVCGVFAVLIFVFTEDAMGLFTDDQRLILFLLPITLIFTIGMLFDALQMTISSILRGLGETWWPTALQSFSFLVVMLPLSYAFAITWERGFQGLMEGMLIGVVFSFGLQMARFWWLTHKGSPVTDEIQVPSDPAGDL